MLRSDRNTYGSIAKMFHWITAVLILFMLFLGYLMGSPGQFNLHKIIGLLILTLTLLRMVWMRTHSHPRLPSEMPRIEIVFARGIQFLLYVSLFCMPLSGWIMSTCFHHPPSLFDLSLPFPGVSANPTLGGICESIHSITAISIIVLVALHVLGALKHAVINKDGVLSSMLPFCRRD